ncbi:MAG: transaldolase [Frankiales bacterium]|nr:transaldolase [Frankiales bacterium]
MTDPLAALSAAGVSIWLDDLDRARLSGGGLAALVAGSHVVGVTTNPSIFEKAISKGATDYADQVHDLAVRGVDLGEAVRALTTYDVRWACDVLEPTWSRTAGVDGRVSIEVDPRLARDTEATVAEAKALAWAVDRPNTFIKIPATVEGLPAITAVLAEGISVNVTLIFSVERYRAVLDAWLTGLERARDAGRDLSRIESVASFFVSRVDTEVDKRLPADSPLRGTAAIANARVAHETFSQVVAGERWQALAAAGAHVQRPLWASTGVKDPAYADTRYVVDLVTRDVVNTMPEATLDATRDHGEVVGDTIVPNYAAAHAALDALTAAGIDLDDVVQVLEEEGVAKFVASWEELLSTVSSALDLARASAGR